MDFNIQDALQLLALGEGQDIIWSIFLYIIFFFALVSLLLTPDKNMVPTLLIAAVLVFAIVAKISLASNDPILNRREFGMLVINIMMGMLPFIAAGTTRVRNRTAKSVPPAIFTGIIGTVYFMMFWLFVQRGG